jgi:hypothetical protein
MKPTYFISLIVILVFLFSCSSSDDGGNNNDQILTNYSSTCNGGITAINGPLAAYWDNAKGVPIPLTQLPLLENQEGYYVHNNYPPLGFPLPQGYRGFDIYNELTATIGVDVFRDDFSAVWSYIPTSTVSGNLPINEATALVVNKMFADLGYNGNDFEVICSETNPENLGLGVTRLYSARLIRFGNFTGQAYVIQTIIDGLPGVSFLSGAIAAGPTNEYDNLVANIFIPLNFQLLVNPDTGLLDSDLDGTPDVDDPAPNNPNIP